MRTKLSFLSVTLCALLLTAGAVRAGDMGMVPMPPPPPQPDFCFDQNLRSFDVYAGYQWKQDDESMDDSDIGDGMVAGLGVNMFFNRYVGVGVEGAWGESESENWMAAGNLIVRWPIDSICLAPYVFGGGGYYFGGSDHKNFWNVGAGLEYKFNEYASLFGDARWVWSKDDEQFLTARGGLRFSF